MPNLTKLDVRPGAAAFAAEVIGLEAGEPPGPADCAAILAAWRHYPVLAFPELNLTPAGLARFAAALGELGSDPYVAPHPDCANVIEVRREAQESTPIFGSTWHSDWSFLPEPPSATLMYGAEIPPQGGDTLFADACAAFDALSPALQRFLHTLEARHSAAAAYGPQGLFARDDPSRSMRIVTSPEAEREHVHPLVCRHPQSGRLALFVNHVYTVGIVGLYAAEGRAMLEFLFRHMVKHEFIYRHRWRAGSVLMWDNRRVVHQAAGGYQGYRRVMYRTTLAGERPAA